MNKKRLLIDQLDSKIRVFLPAQQIVRPSTGWIKATRMALGMSLKQLGARLSMTSQGAQQIEKRERDGSITLKGLKEVAHQMDMDLVYGFVPKDGSLDKLIEKKAFELAKKVVLRTSHTMKLEDQENSEERIQKAIAERTFILKQEIPKILWD